MKRYLLFAGSSYYPRGGWLDFIDSFDTPEEAKEVGQCHDIFIFSNKEESYPKYDWFHIIDKKTGRPCLTENGDLY